MIVKDNVGTLAGAAERERAADALARASDEDSFSSEAHIGMSEKSGWLVGIHKKGGVERAGR